jgi:metal-dependent amidase/aminoacylase/carboxypeptidase family protein
LGGTIRALDNEAAASAMAQLERICHGIGAVHGAEIAPVSERRLPGVVNDPEVTSRCAVAAKRLLGADAVLTTGEPSLGAEDFADYLQQVPGCMMRLGVKYAGREVTPLHTPTFDIDESALILGSRLFAASVIQLTAAHVD